MNTEQKVIAYLKRCKAPKTQAEISRGAKVNPNTLRRVLGDGGWAPKYECCVVREKNSGGTWTYWLA